MTSLECSPPTPAPEISEDVRLSAVQGTELLDTPSELEFDQLVSLASEICGTPISLFTLVDKKRQWFKAGVGLDGVRETPRDIAFCAHAIRQQDIFVVEDATLDARFEANPLVTGSPGIRFYAGVPLEGVGGAMLGTLCVIDTKPRRLTEAQNSALKVLAAQVRARLELRAERRKLQTALREKDEAMREKDAALERFASSDRRFRTFMNNAPFLSHIKDAKGRYVFYNDRVAERFKIDSQQWLGKTDHQIWPKKVADELRAHDLEAMNARHMIERKEETCEPGQDATCWKTYKFPWWNERAEMMLGGFAIDITEEEARQKALQEANEKLQKMATVDPLTGLANRRVMEERLEFEFRFARRHKTPLSVVLLDLDNFKQINDTRGHAAGDEMLRRVGRILTAQMRVTDVAARVGGEEFVLLLPGATPEGANTFAERLRLVFHEWPVEDRVTASIGIATLDQTMVQAQRLIERADASMYEAKRGGKDRIVAHQDLLDRAMSEVQADKKTARPRVILVDGKQ